MNKDYFEIIRAGINSTFQDLGRNNLYHIGIPFSGAMDQRNYKLANTIVGNKIDSPVIEFAYQGPLIKYRGVKVNFVITGEVVFKLIKKDNEIDGNCYESYSIEDGDLVDIETSKNASPSLHWLSSSTTGKARSAIRRYWQDKSTENKNTTVKNYSSTIEIDLPHKPGVLGHITSLIGLNKGNIVNLEILKRKKEHLKFSIDLQIKDLKNFTNLISQIKQSNLTFKIIRHKQKKNAFIKRIFENFKRN